MKRSIWMIVSWVVILCIISACSQSEDEDEFQDDDDDTQADFTLSVDGQDLDVSLSLVTTQAWEGMDAVNLAELVDAVLSQDSALPSRDSLEFDFVAADGFHPSDVGCEPLAGSALSDGFIEVNSKNLMWNEAAQMRGCYSVDNLAGLIAEPLGSYVPDGNDDDDDDDADTPAPDNVQGTSVTIVVGAEEEAVDMGPLAQWQSGEVIWSEVMEIIRSVSMDLPSLQSATFEVEASDGFKPSDAGCDPLTYDDFSQGRIDVQNADVFWLDEAEIPSCYHVSGVAKIHILAE